MSIHPQNSSYGALTSALVQALFPAGAAAAEMRSAADPTHLFPEEAEQLGRAVPKRVREFTAGRLCARLALADLGIVDFPLRVAQDRQPVWPPTIVGSITHTHGFCAAVAGHATQFAGLGIDVEIIGHVGADLWATICVPRESAWLESLPESERAAAATLLFSAKEAFYKCQYPLTQEWLDFHDLWVEPLHQASGVFTVRGNRPLAIERFAAFPLEGRFVIHDGFVTAGVALPRAR